MGQSEKLGSVTECQGTPRKVVPKTTQEALLSRRVSFHVASMSSLHVLFCICMYACCCVLQPLLDRVLSVQVLVFCLPSKSLAWDPTFRAVLPAALLMKG